MRETHERVIKNALLRFETDKLPATTQKMKHMKHEQQPRMIR